MNRKVVYGNAGAVVVVAVVLAAMFWPVGNKTIPAPAASTAPNSEDQHATDRVRLTPEMVKSVGIETAEVAERDSVSLLTVTGTVEANQEKIQQATPLVSGRVDRVPVVLGDHVNKDAVIAVISSPEVAEMHGKLHEAETRLTLAEETLQRVQRAENRAGALQAKARLDEAEATLRRTRRLIELGAAAGKDLVAAESGYASAKAEYDYQSNISLSREVQEARAEASTTQVEVMHLRQSLLALGASLTENSSEPSHDISTVILRAPVSGTVIERFVNPGAGIEAGKPLFTIADMSTLWVIANAPEGQIGILRSGTLAEIHSPELGETTAPGRVSYIDPVLNEQTRTGRVRIEIRNPGERLKVGMFVSVNFQTGGKAMQRGSSANLVVPDGAVQRINDRTVVFVPDLNKPGDYVLRNVELGDMINGFHPVLSGLSSGERVVTRGSFTLKAQLMKGELGE